MLRFMRREGGDGGDGANGNGNDGAGGGSQGGGGGGGAGGGGGDGSGDKPITMTPAQLNDRLERAKSGAVGEFVKGLGYEKPDEVSAAVKAAREAADAQKTELQRAQEERDAERTRREQAEARVATEARTRGIQSAALKAGIPGDRLDAVTRLVDASAVTVGDDGTVTGADEAVAAMLAANAWVTAQAGGAGRGTGGGEGAGGGGGAAALTDAQKQAAKISGVTEEAYARALQGAPGSETHEQYVRDAAERARAGSAKK